MNRRPPGGITTDHKNLGADTEVGHKLAESTKKYAKEITRLEAPGGSGGPLGVPLSVLTKDTEDLASPLGIDGRGIKAKSVPTTDKYDITGTDVAVTRANDAVRVGGELPPPSDHTVRGKNHLEKTVITASGAVEGRK